MNGKIKYEISANMWQHASQGGWCFISLPITVAKEIRENLRWQEEGWGRLRVTAKIGNTEWKTAIWFDTKQNTYLLPIKAAVRMKERIEPGQEIKTFLFI
jgi:hypothetical protein